MFNFELYSSQPLLVVFSVGFLLFSCLGTLVGFLTSRYSMTAVFIVDLRKLRMISMEFQSEGVDQQCIFWKFIGALAESILLTSVLRTQ